MSKILSKKCIIGSIFLLLPSIVFSSMDSRVIELESEMQQVHTKTPMGTYGAQTATARPVLGKRGGFIEVNALLWDTKLGGTDFCYKVNNLKATAPFKGDVKDVDFDRTWGFRVGLGYNFNYDGWSIGLRYTYFHPHGNKSVGTKGENAIVPLKGSPNLVNSLLALGNVPLLDNFLFPGFRVVACARDQFDIFYQTIDLELARAYYVSGKLSFRPHFGVKAAWIDLDEKIWYEGAPSCGDEVSCVGLPCDFFAIQSENDFRGLGPRTGIDSKWYLGNGVSIFANISGGLLFGFFDVETRESTNQQNAGDAVLGITRDFFFKFDADRHALIPTIQLFAGLRYDTYMHKRKSHIGIGLGYEVNYWWRINQMLKMNDWTSTNYDRYSEDLGVYGVTLDIKIDF